MVTQEGENVGVWAVYGNFDDAQSGVKRIFSDEAMRADAGSSGGTSSPRPTPSTGAGFCPRWSTTSRPTATWWTRWRRGDGRAGKLLRAHRQFRRYSGGVLCQADGAARGQADLRFQQQQCPDGLPAHRSLRPQPPLPQHHAAPPWTFWCPAIWSGCSSTSPEKDDAEVRGIYGRAWRSTGRYEVSQRHPRTRWRRPSGAASAARRQTAETIGTVLPGARATSSTPTPRWRRRCWSSTGVATGDAAPAVFVSTASAL